MDNLSKTGTENNIYDIRTGKIIEEPILEEKKPDELSEDNFQTFYQNTFLLDKYHHFPLQHHLGHNAFPKGQYNRIF